MNKILVFLTAITLTFFGVNIFSDTLAKSVNFKYPKNSFILARTPAFKDYPVTNIYKGKPAPVDLSSHPEARKFRDRLRYGAKQGSNFAGHYTLVEWGCGSPCQSFAIVNAKTGKVYMGKFNTSWGYGYKLNSNLLIADYESPPSDEIIQRERTYYIWKNGNLKKIYTEKMEDIRDRD